ncbi:MAG: restriction system-associated AAA family ATPase [Haliscomenobacter sp.]|nr:restriction system-associated AAA family ATPase [Haliscomenobacter sp.]
MGRITQFKIQIVKEPNDLPKITITGNDSLTVKGEIDPDIFILPTQVIAYSSGQNELISNPFIRSAYHYFDELTSKESKEISEELALSRLFQLDYENGQLITICNYLFSLQNNVDLISEAVKVEDLDSFSIIIRFRNYRNNPIEFAQIPQNAIENPKACATAQEETEGEANFRQLKLSFKVGPEVKRAFQRKFGSSILLFRDLFFLNLMNIHCHPVDTRRRIKNSGSRDDNLAYMVPVPPRDRLVFLLEKVKFKKIGEAKPIKYKNLSDGEHQLMHVLGSIMLLNMSGSLLLLDEPETHFNPEWRSKLISLINEATKEKDERDQIRKQEIFITSHSPFIVSDCRKHRVFIFENGKARNPTINTYGTSVSILLEEIFGKEETISEMAMSELERLRNLPSNTLDEIKRVKEASKILGESVEKVLLFRQLLLKEKEIRERNDQDL